jgi:O-antigen/teichoic acid export membrane protein
MFKSALLILSGNAFGSAMLLVRNLVVARLISVEDYGIAATFAISMAIVEMITALGLHQMIVQDSKGNDPDLQAGLQGFHLLRGLFSSALLFLLAGPIARFLGIPEVSWAYQMLALLPAMNGLMHFDIYRLQRQMKYLPSILSSSVPAFLSVLLIWPLYTMFGDYRIMLFSVLAQGLFGIVASHLLAERSYRLSLSPQIMQRALQFGWPLLLNNVLLFAVFQGDKLVVGHELGLVALGIFAMGFTLTLTPTLVAAKSAQSFFLPQLSASKANPERLLHLSMATLQTSIVNGLLVVLVVVLIGEPVILFLLGQKYAALVPYLTWLAILQALRVFKAGSSVVALAQGQTSNAMIANLCRAVSLGVAWYVAAHGGNLYAIIWIAIAGEAVGYPVSLALVHYRLKLPLKPMVLPILLSVATLGAAGLHAYLANAAAPHQGWVLAGMILLFGLSLVTMRDLRHYIAKRTLSRYTE